MQHFGLNCKYFSKAVDCGLNQQKTEGSLAKSGRRRGIFESGLSVLDLTVQIRSGSDLIPAVGS